MKRLDIIKRLEEHGVKATANRILVFSVLEQSTSPLSMAEIVDILETLDRSSVFRTLNVFSDNDLVHCIDDGSGSLKYEVCRREHHCAQDMHAHFLCTRCGRLYCLDNVAIPSISLPNAFEANSYNFVIKGICASCSIK